MNITEYSGRLCANASSSRLKRAELGIAPIQASELHIPLSFDTDENVPIIYSYSETFSFLIDLVTECRSQLQFARILAKQQMPVLNPLPSILLENNIVLLHDVEIESDFLKSQSIEHICIEIDFKKYGWDIGDNSIRIVLASRAHKSEVYAGFEAVTCLCKKWNIALSPHEDCGT